MTIKKVVDACTTEKPTVSEKNPNDKQIKAAVDLEEKYFLCKNFTLNSLIVSSMTITA